MCSLLSSWVFWVESCPKPTLHFKYGRCSEDQEEDPRMTWSIKIVVTDADCREKMTRWKHPGPAPLTNQKPNKKLNLRNLLIQTKKDNGLQVGTNQIQAVCSLIDMISIKCGWFCLIMVSAQVTSHHSRGWLLQIQIQQPFNYSHFNSD